MLSPPAAPRAAASAPRPASVPWLPGVDESWDPADAGGRQCLALHGHAADQRAVEHRDGAFTPMTWVESASANYAQLRFVDQVQGGICLHPTWEEMVAFNRDGSLAHLLGPAGKRPGPGSLGHSRATCLFPAGVMLGRRWRDADALREMPLEILVTGLGAGVGVVALAHHFPQASITVVDVDPGVAALACTRYPLLRWLAHGDRWSPAPRTRDGRARVRIEIADAGVAVAAAAAAGRIYDVVVLDAYGAGFAVPDHLTAVGFFAQVAAVLHADGCVALNLIASYAGERASLFREVVANLRSVGLQHLHALPVLNLAAGETPAGAFDPTVRRNHLLLAARHELAPGAHPGWTALERFQPYPELPLETFVGGEVALGCAIGGAPLFRSTSLPLSSAWLSEASCAELDARWRAAELTRPQLGSGPYLAIADARLAHALRAEVLAQGRPAPGWAHADGADVVLCRRVDWVRHARTVWRDSVIAAFRRGSDGAWIHGSFARATGR